jgi:hypothetical protein
MRPATDSRPVVAALRVKLSADRRVGERWRPSRLLAQRVWSVCSSLLWESWARRWAFSEVVVYAWDAMERY